MVTIGIFDGVHLGHQKILKRLIEAANEIDGQALLLSFFPHPRVVLNPDAEDLRLINTLDEKISLLDKLGLQNMIIHPFDIGFSNITSEEFIEKILIEKLLVKKVVIGYDHHFGKDRTGGFPQLLKYAKAHNFVVEEIPAQDIKDIHISSTKIRNALQIGDVALANKYLGHNYSLRGEVVRGNSDGKKLGFPTANIKINETFKLIPANGVYVGFVNMNKENYKCMINIGNRPTFKNADWAIEVHLLDFDGDLYGQNLEIEFITKLRNERKFDSPEILSAQLKEDKKQAIKLLS